MTERGSGRAVDRAIVDELVDATFPGDSGHHEAGAEHDENAVDAGDHEHVGEAIVWHRPSDVLVAIVGTIGFLLVLPIAAILELRDSRRG